MFMLFNHPSFGAKISKEAKATYARSPQFNAGTGVFENRRPATFSEIMKRFTWRDYLEIFKAGVDRTPASPLPAIKPDLDAFMESGSDIKIIWLGHSSLLIRMGGKTILIDPVLSGAASPFPFLVKRFQPPPLTYDTLPPIDFIVLSHDHYDHLDMKAARFFRDKNVSFITPLGVGEHLKYWGVPAQNITELDWWESFKTDGITFTATPAQHASGRRMFSGRDETLWASWVISNPAHKLYFSGDSGYDTHFKEIGEREGPFDIAFMDNGQYNEKWREVHLLPEEGIQAFKDLNAKTLFPVHWGTFKLAWHTWYEPITRMHALSSAQNIPLIAPVPGEVVVPGKQTAGSLWWEDLRGQPAGKQ